MAKKFACKSIGIECGFESRAETEEALLGQISEHAKTAHSMPQLDEATTAKIKAAIITE